MLPSSPRRGVAAYARHLPAPITALLPPISAERARDMDKTLFRAT